MYASNYSYRLSTFFLCGVLCINASSPEATTAQHITQNQETLLRGRTTSHDTSTKSVLSFQVDDHRRRLQDEDHDHENEHEDEDHEHDHEEEEHAYGEEYTEESEESEYDSQLLGSATTTESTNTAPILVGAIILYAAAAAILFLSTRSTESERDGKDIPLFKEEAELVNSFSGVFGKYHRQTSRDSDTSTYVADEHTTLPSIDTIEKERKVAQGICNIIGAKRPNPMTLS